MNKNQFQILTFLSEDHASLSKCENYIKYAEIFPFLLQKISKITSSKTSIANS